MWEVNHHVLDSRDSSRDPWSEKTAFVIITLRELTTCELTHVVDTRCLRDTEGSLCRHRSALGTMVRLVLCGDDEVRTGARLPA